MKKKDNHEALKAKVQKNCIINEYFESVVNLRPTLIDSILTRPTGPQASPSNHTKATTNIPNRTLMALDGQTDTSL